jgi:hypothetical protein
MLSLRQLAASEREEQANDMRMSVFKQGYMLLVVSLLTAGILTFIGIGLEILVLYGPLALLAILGVLTAILLAIALIPALPYLIAMIALWPNKIPNDYQPPAHRVAASVHAIDAPPTEAIALLDAHWLYPWTVPRALVYAGIVTAMLALGFLVFRHARPGTIPDIQVYTTFGTEVVYLATLFAYMLIKRRRDASRSS